MIEKDFKISVDQNALEKAFFDEFGSSLNDAQIDIITSGFRKVHSSAGIDTASMDLKTIDPLSDPVLARDALMILPESQVEPSEKPFVIPLVQYLNTAGVALSPEIVVLKEKWDFFLVHFGLNIVPRAKERFGIVEIRFSFSDDEDILTYALNPDSQVEEQFSVNTSVTLGISTMLNFITPTIQNNNISAGSSVSSELKAGLIYKWDYKRLKAKIVATGIKSSYAQWIINSSEELIGSVQLSAIISVPKGISSLRYKVNGCYEIDRGWAWWKKRIPVLIQSQKFIHVDL